MFQSWEQIIGQAAKSKTGAFTTSGLSEEIKEKFGSGTRLPSRQKIGIELRRLGFKHEKIHFYRGMGNYTNEIIWRR